MPYEKHPPMTEHEREAHRQYIQVLRRMTPEQRLKRAFELSEMTLRLFKQGLRERFPEMSDEDLHALYLKRLEKCHNRNW
jgi:hypothetical protein